MNIEEAKKVLCCHNIAELAFVGLIDLLNDDNDNDLNILKQEAIDTVLNELEEQTESNKELNKVIITYKAMINEMAKELYIEGYCKNIKCKKCEAKNFVECIKEYFYKKVSDNK